MSQKNQIGGITARKGKGLLWKFEHNESGSFSAPQADYMSRLYFPLMNSSGLKSWVNPQLKGDVCSSFSHYLTIPLVTEDIDKTLSSRNIWVVKKGEQPWSATGMSAWQRAQKWNNQEATEVIAEPGIYSTLRSNTIAGISAKITVFAPQTEDKTELLLIEIENTNQVDIEFDLVYSIPVFGRHADNLRDHRQVTTMFQKVRREEYGVRVAPNIVHDEHGHRQNYMNYMVLGADAQGNPPQLIWLSMLDFTGEGGSLDLPEAVFRNLKPSREYLMEADGKEAIGAFKFESVKLKAGASTSFVVMNGMDESLNAMNRWLNRYGSEQKIRETLSETRAYWQNYTQSIRIQTADSDFNQWVQWVIYQVKARQEFGNSFLPDYGYGRGGRGWRDLWQDLLSVLLVDPVSARNEIVNNFNGIRIDGSNATIIGSKPGEFIADRNNVPRSWSDHGSWPVFVTNFYLQQTGDFDLLLKEMPYWKDQFIHRTQKIDKRWSANDGNKLLSTENEIYQGSIFEHLLLQQLSAFYTVGKHNILRLEGADWNDTYDMARENGETVGFHAFYANNFRMMISWLEYFKSQGLHQIEFLEEIEMLLDRTETSETLDYSIPEIKKARVDEYFSKVAERVSGNKKAFSIDELIMDFESKSAHMMEVIAKQEWISINEKSGFFNGHYNNKGKAIDCFGKDYSQMDLTTQVMTIMNFAASDEQISKMNQAIDLLLRDKDTKGIRLCRPFPSLDLNVGRLTGFVYGHKEHGSKWMQQNVMLAYALYLRKQTRAANDLVREVFELVTNSSVSKIFPGIPSYLEPGDRGAYVWLTGSSAWMMLGLTTQMFGVRGDQGNLLFEPQLSPDLFNKQGEASIEFSFQSKRIHLTYLNKAMLPVKDFKIGLVQVNGVSMLTPTEAPLAYVMNYNDLTKYFDRDLNEIKIYLQKK